MPGHRLEQLCHDHGLRFTEHRRMVLEVLDASTDHPAASEIHRRAAVGHSISVSTVYRILKTLSAAGLVVRRDFGDGKARYESVTRRHDHLVDVRSGAIVEFDEAALQPIIESIAARLGYRLIDYRLELLAEARGAVIDRS